LTSVVRKEASKNRTSASTASDCGVLSSLQLGSIVIGIATDDFYKGQQVRINLQEINDGKKNRRTNIDFPTERIKTGISVGTSD
jgi:hypothetical protein